MGYLFHWFWISSSFFTFGKIIDTYTKFNKDRFGDELGQIISDGLRSISMDEGQYVKTRGSGVAGRGTKDKGQIIQFFNKVYVPRMQQYLLNNDALKVSAAELKKKMKNSPSPPPKISGEPARLPPTTVVRTNTAVNLPPATPSNPDVPMTTTGNAPPPQDSLQIPVPLPASNGNSTSIQINGRHISVNRGVAPTSTNGN